MKRKTAKELLAETFRELAQTKPIDKITVKDLTEACGYSTATFYRQFKDKYDLIAWDYARDLEAIMARADAAAHIANPCKQDPVPEFGTQRHGRSAMRSARVQCVKKACLSRRQVFQAFRKSLKNLLIEGVIAVGND